MQVIYAREVHVLDMDREYCLGPAVIQKGGIHAWDWRPILKIVAKVLEVPNLKTYLCQLEIWQIEKVPLKGLTRSCSSKRELRAGSVMVA